MTAVQRVSILRPRRSSRRELGEVLAFGVPFLLLDALVAMVLFGLAHDIVSPQIPPLGYVQSLVLLALVRAVLPSRMPLMRRDLALPEGEKP